MHSDSLLQMNILHFKSETTKQQTQCDNWLCYHSDNEQKQNEITLYTESECIVYLAIITIWLI